MSTRDSNLIPMSERGVDVKTNGSTTESTKAPLASPLSSMRGKEFEFYVATAKSISAHESSRESVDRKKEEPFEQEKLRNFGASHRKLSKMEDYVRGLVREKSNLKLEVSLSKGLTATNPDEKTSVNPEDVSSKFRIKEGFLKKKSHGLVGHWQKRWFYLIKDQLIYFKRGTAKPAGIIPLSECQPCKENPTNKGRFSMKYGDSSRDTFYFDTHRSKKDVAYEEEGERQAWVEAINHNIILLMEEEMQMKEGKFEAKHRPTGNVPNLACCAGRQRGWHISAGKQTAFENLKTVDWRRYARTAKTGDVLLFNTRGTGASVIRFGTNSYYDHVGIVLKIEGKNASVLEALGDGVGIVEIRDFWGFRWWKQYRCIAVRRLHADLPEQSVAALERFISMVIGRKYGLWTPSALKRKNSVLCADDPNRSFFCSELVACAYKRVGLLPDHQASCTYVPGAFAECTKMRLLKGAFLGPEEKLIFDKSQLQNSNSKTPPEKKGCTVL